MVTLKKYIQQNTCKSWQTVKPLPYESLILLSIQHTANYLNFMLQIIFKTAGHSWYLQGIGWSVTLIAEKNQAILIQYWWKELVSHEVYRCHRLAIIESANNRDRGSVLVRARDCRPPNHRLDQWWLILYLTFRNKRKWYLSHTMMMFFPENVSKNIVCKTANYIKFNIKNAEK